MPWSDVRDDPLERDENWSRAFQECPLKKVLVAKGDEDRVKKLLKKSGGLDVSELKFGEMSEP